MNFRTIIALCFVFFLLPNSSIAQDCIDYEDYLHWVGNENTYMSTYGVAISENYAYVVYNTGGLQVIDITDPENPVLTGGVDLRSARCVAVLNNYAYVGTWYDGLQVIDITNPHNPVIISNIESPGHPVFGVSVSGGYAYIAVLDGYWNLQVIDISSPSDPVLTGGVSIPGAAYGVAVLGSYAYVAALNSGLQVIDITDPENLDIVGSVYASDGSARGVAVSGSYAYVADQENGLLVIDIIDPENPDIAGSVYTSGAPMGVAVSGDYAYCADFYLGLQISDVSNPVNPILTGWVDTPNYAADVTALGSYAYVADGTGGGLQVIDIADPAIPVIVGSVATLGTALGVAISGDYTYVADGTSGLHVIDITDPENPVVVGSIDTPNYAFGVAISGSYAYVADGASGLQVIDISHSENPNIIGSVDTPDNARGIAISGNYAYVADQENGLQVVDIADPETPFIAGNIDTPDYASGVAISGNYAFVADQASGLQVIDTTNPYNPVLIGSLRTLVAARGIAISGGYAYLADHYGGLQVIDISNPEFPAPTGGVDTPGYAIGVAVAENCVCIADGTGGLQIALLQCVAGSADHALLSPQNLSSVTTCDIPFSWTDSGADYYQLYVDDDDDFSSPQISPFHFAPMDVEFIYTTSFPWGCNWLDEGQYYWKVRAWTGDDYEESEEWSFTYAPPIEEFPDWGPLYRLYNHAATDHFYCSSQSHSDIAQDQGYVEEGVEGFVSHSRFNHSERVSLFRFNSVEPGLDWHLYTADASQVDPLIESGLRFEGITGYVFATAVDGTVPLYHLAAPEGMDHLYTTSEVERDRVQAELNFTDEGIVAYVSPFGGDITLPGHAYSGIVGAGMSAGTGNFNHYQQADFNIPSIGLPLTFSHIYNSGTVHLLTQNRPLGPGWSHTYDACIVTIPDLWLVIWPDGSVHRYSQADGKCIDKEYGIYDEMEIYPDGMFEITKKNQVVYTFERPSGVGPDYPSMLTSIHDRNGNEITCTYEADELRLLRTVTGPAGRQLTFDYIEIDNRHFLETVTDVAGNRMVTFAYNDTDGNLTSYTDCAGRETEYIYVEDPVLGGLNHQLSRIILPEDNQIDNEYAGRKIKSQSWTGSTGQLTLGYIDDTHVSVTNGEGHEALLTFDPSSRLESVENIHGTARVWREDWVNPALSTRIRDRNGNETEYEYDGRGNRTLVSPPIGQDWTYSYDDMNNPTWIADPIGHETIFIYDLQGNIESMTDPRSHTTTWQHLPNGLVESVTSPLGHATSFEWDAFGNLSSVQDPLSNTTSFFYDDVGRMTRKVDAEGYESTFTYTCEGRLHTQLDADGTTTYDHDDNGNMTSITDAMLQATSWDYNVRDLLESITNALGEVTSFTYNDDGTIDSRLRPTGTTDYSYDQAGLLVGISSTHTALNRDPNGNILELLDDDENESFSYTYDALNRLTSSTDDFGNTVSYEYDDASNLTQLTYPDSKTVTYTYYPDNRMKTVEDWNGQVTTYTYSNDGLLESVAFHSSGSAWLGYDDAGRLTGISHRKADYSIIAEYEFALLDGLGNHLVENRVEPLAQPPLENWECMATYNAANRVTNHGVHGYDFDGAGNLLSRTGPDPWTCSWNYENHLTDFSGAGTATYTYDTFGHRLSATRNGETRRYVLDVSGSMSRVLMETDGAGNPLHYYVHGLGLISRVNPDGTTRYYRWNNVGSIVAMTDEIGNVTHSYSYDPYGNVLASNEEDFNPYRFIGRWGVMDEDNGLYFMRARYYDPETGRFISEDPIWSTNSYVYGTNNPISFSDPSGLFPWGAVAKHGFNAFNALRDTVYFAGYVGSLGYANKDKVSASTRYGGELGRAVGKDAVKVMAPPLAYAWTAVDLLLAINDLNEGDPTAMAAASSKIIAGQATDTTSGIVPVNTAYFFLIDGPELWQEIEW